MSNISLVIGREYRTRVRKRAFIITTILMPLLIVAMMVVPALIAMYSGGEQRVISVYDPTGKITPELKNTDIVKFETSTLGYPSMVEANSDASGYLVLSDAILSQGNQAVELYMSGASSFELEGQITRQIENIIERERIATSSVPQLDSIMRSVTADVSIATYKINQDQAAIEQGADTSEKEQTSSAMSMAVGYASGILIYMFVLIYGVMVMQGVVEEKSSRIIEVMVSSVRPFELMMGKILGIALVALTQVAIWIVLVGIGMGVVSGLITPEAAMNGAQMGAGAAVEIPSGLGGAMSLLADPMYLLGIVGGFILYFVGGYLLYASMYAAVGSAVDSVEDSQQMQTPLTIPIIISFFVMMSAIKDPSSGLAFWGSMIPFSSPIVMMARIPYGVDLWEILLSVGILYGSFIAMTYFAAKIYRVGIFMYGKKPSLMDILRWTKYRS